MSVSIHVEHSRPLSVEEVSERTRIAVEVLLGSQAPLKIQISSTWFREADDPTVPIFADESTVAICGILGRPEQVIIHAFMSPTGVDSDGRMIYSDVPFVSFGAYGSLSPLSWALMAAVAIAFAQAHGHIIFDDAGFYTKQCEITSAQFSDALKPTEVFGDLDTAAAALYERMDKSSECDAFLKSLLSKPDYR